MRRLVCLLLFAIPLRLAAQGILAPADSALHAGEPWRASQLLAPLLNDPATRTPDAVMLAARAAAAWEGWATVRSLLEHQTWLDSAFDRLGRRLLAQAALADQRNADAVVQAYAAVGGDSGRDRNEQAKRLVLLARGYDRLEQLDSAAAVYRRAMAMLPALADWLALRAAGVTRDSAVRAELFLGIALPAATPRIPWTEALARERTEDFAGAAVRYDQLGAHVPALRVRWRAAYNDSTRRLVADSIAALMRNPASTATEARDALDLIEKIDPPFTRDDRLDVARRAAAVTRSQDAADEFAGAEKEGALAARDRVMYGTALGQLSRWTDAAAQFAGIRDPALAGQAAYFHARALMRTGQNDDAITALRQVVRRYPRDTVAAATALHLLADLATDAGKMDSARADYLKLALKYPSSTQRPRAILLAALIAYARGYPKVAARELAHAIEIRALPNELDAAHYWLARAERASGDTAAARAGWLALIARGPESFYAVRAAARLDSVPWPTTSLQPFAAPDSLDGILARAALLDGLGLDTEAKFERDRITSEAHGADAERVAEVFLLHGFPSRAAQLANRAAASGVTRDPTMLQLIYPLPFAFSLRDVAEREHVDPLLVAAVIRQESGFEPHATSRTNARGLMQVEPATGSELAQALGFPDFDPALLWIAPVNLAFGVHHFAAAIARYPEIERGLAAYNAGVSRVDSWSRAPLNGVARTADHARDALDDVDLFVERIPFVETRDYVRAIVRNEAVYTMIYGRR